MVDENQAKRLHYDMMEIGLAILAHQGKSTLFRIFDAALTDLDWKTLLTIKRGFAMLPLGYREAVLGHDGEPEAIKQSLGRLESYLKRLGIATPPLIESGKSAIEAAKQRVA